MSALGSRRAAQVHGIYACRQPSYDLPIEIRDEAKQVKSKSR